MSKDTAEKCFVIMPFGVKTLRDGTTHDYDKVYRVIIQRAIRQTGMDSIRADEHKSSQIIHAEMFKHLRDRPVVLADISMSNPNVFYELGVRHVMSPTGTVLMCRRGSDLPFDVKLSRVIFYDYDGVNLDWEEAERVCAELQYALEEAKRGTPDSPIHALLERVMPNEHYRATDRALLDFLPDEPLDRYQLIIAEYWRENNYTISNLLDQIGWSVFGMRSLAYYCLAMEQFPEKISAVALRLFELQQYDVSSRIYKKLDEQNRLCFFDYLDYGSCISELSNDINGAEEGLRILQRALNSISFDPEGIPVNLKSIKDAFKVYHKLSGMHVWKWRLTGSEDDLDDAIKTLDKTAGLGRRILEQTNSYNVGRFAKLHLRLLVLLRAKDKDIDRPDIERHREAILTLQPAEITHPSQDSYFRWYRAIALADAGDADSCRRMALAAFSEDAKIMDLDDCRDVGRKQYKDMRRFLEDTSDYLRNPSLIGHISQVLQIGHLSICKTNGCLWHD